MIIAYVLLAWLAAAIVLAPIAGRFCGMSDQR